MSTTTIKTEIANGEIRVTSPYSDSFVAKAKNLNGKWRNGAWVFPESIKEHVLKAVTACYGVDGTTEYPTCIISIANFSDWEWGTLSVFGRIILRAFARDAKLGDDVILIEGNTKSGGSLKQPKAVIEDATFEIHNFPVAALERENVKAAIAEGWVTVKGLPAEQEAPAPPADRSTKEGEAQYREECRAIVEAKFPVGSKVLAPLYRGTDLKWSTAHKPHELATVKDVRVTGVYIRVDIAFADGHEYGSMSGTNLPIQQQWTLEQVLEDLRLIPYPFSF